MQQDVWLADCRMMPQSMQLALLHLAVRRGDYGLQPTRAWAEAAEGSTAGLNITSSCRPQLVTISKHHFLVHTLQLVTLDRGRDMLAMEEYNSSFSMRGVCVELTAVVRPRCLVKTLTTAYPTDAALPGKLLQARRGPPGTQCVQRPRRPIPTHHTRGILAALLRTALRAHAAEQGRLTVCGACEFHAPPEMR